MRQLWKGKTLDRVSQLNQGDMLTWGHEKKPHPDVPTGTALKPISINPMNDDEPAGAAECVKSKRLFAQSNEL